MFFIFFLIDGIVQHLYKQFAQETLLELLFLDFMNISLDILVQEIA